MKYFIVVLLSLGLTACYVPDDEAKRVLEQANRVLDNTGYTSIKLGEVEQSRGCGRDQYYSVTFKATSINGHPAYGKICTGLSSIGATVFLY
jgi:hypothetical protein